ncbi:hypothetical protein [Streptomyces canus]|uniref:hypothetical protein n=1 Tax=Streptomyces canus TaxID=58343 RepID=UPI0036E954A2
MTPRRRFWIRHCAAGDPEGSKSGGHLAGELVAPGTAGLAPHENHHTPPALLGPSPRRR